MEDGWKVLAIVLAIVLLLALPLTYQAGKERRNQEIREGIQELTNNLLNHINLNLSDIDFFAIHPGGKRILDVIEEKLNISKEQNKYARQTLREFGNMSSPTVLFVIKSIMDQVSSSDDGKHLLSFAFGPGLTLESAVLQVKCDA